MATLLGGHIFYLYRYHVNKKYIYLCFGKQQKLKDFNNTINKPKKLLL